MDEEGFSAVYVGTGAGLPHFMHIDGENLNGVYSANEFLTRVNLMRAYQFPNVATPVYVGKMLPLSVLETLLWMPRVQQNVLALNRYI